MIPAQLVVGKDIFIPGLRQKVGRSAFIESLERLRDSPVVCFDGLVQK